MKKRASRTTHVVEVAESQRLYDDFCPPLVAGLMREKAKSWRMIENCENCPFRDDKGAIELEAGRLDEIKASIADGRSDFYCHKSVYRKGRESWGDEEDDTFHAQKGDLLCHGACEYQDHEGSGPSQYRRVAERLDGFAVARELEEAKP